MADIFSGIPTNLDSPASSFLPAAPSDTVDLPQTSRYLCFTGAGTIKVDMADGTTQTIPSGQLAIATLHRLRVRRVYITGTTATGIWIGY